MKKLSKFLLLTLLGWSLSNCKKEEPKQTNPPLTIDPGSSEFYGSVYHGLPADVNDWVFYEVNLRAFSADGDLNGVRLRLDSIKSLGTNIIWLMPIYPIGDLKGINSPYSIKDFTAVSSEYGSLEDLRLLIEEAHQRNMAVIMDFVANHTAWDHPWIQDHPDWYTKDGNGNIVHPPGTNWLDVADLNFGSLDMQNALIQSMKYWIREVNIDGYRCDYANGVPYDFWLRAIDSLEAYHPSNLVMLAEGDRFNHLLAGFDVRFSWSAYGKLKEVFINGAAASTYSNYHQAEYNVVTGNTGIMRFITNHDESAWDQTPVQLFGSQELAVAAMIANTFTGGIPLIYSSQEVGRSSQLPFFSNDPINWNENPEVLSKYRQFMEIYSTEPAARAQDLIDYSTNDVLAFTKDHNGSKLLIMVNCRNQQSIYQVPTSLTALSWQNLLINQAGNITPSIILAPGEYAIYKQL